MLITAAIIGSSALVGASVGAGVASKHYGEVIYNKDGTISQLEQKLSGVQESNRKLEAANTELVDRNNGLNNKAARLEGQRDDLVATVQEVKEQNKELEDENAELNNIVVRLEEQKKGLAATVQNTKKQLNEALESNKGLVAANTGLANRVEGLEEQLGSLTNTARELMTTIEEMKGGFDVFGRNFSMFMRVIALQQPEIVKALQSAQEIGVHQQIDYQQQGDQSFNAESSQQQGAGTQAASDQASQQRRPSAQVANDLSVHSIFCSRSSSLSSSSSNDDGDQPCPSSMLSKVQPMSRSQSLSSLYSSDSDIEIISRSQCR